MVQTYKKYGVTTDGYRGERAILEERVIEGLTQPEFSDAVLQLEDNSPKTIYLTNNNFGEGFYILLPNATNLWLNWQVTIINDSSNTCPIYYYTSDSSQLNLFKEVTSGNMITCILLDNVQDTDTAGTWTTLRTTEQSSADLLYRYTSDTLETTELSWNQLLQEDSDESDEISSQIYLGSLLEGTSLKSIYIKTVETFIGATSLNLSIGTLEEPNKFINNYDLTLPVADNNFTKDLFEEMLSTTSNVDLYATVSGEGLNNLSAGLVKIVIEKPRLIDPTILKNPIVQTQVPIGVIMSYAFSDIPEGYWRLDGTIFPNAATSIPEFVKKLNLINNSLPGTEKLIVTETVWQNTVNTYGSCGKFSWVGSGLRFPKINCFVQGLSDLTKLSQLTEAGVPAINHYHLFGWNSQNNNGNFVASPDTRTASMPANSGTRGWNGSGGGGWYNGTIPSYSGNMITTLPIIYNQSGTSTSEGVWGKSDTVTPLNIKYPYIISVYNKVQSASTLDIDAIIEASVNKANVSLNNITDIDSSFISKLSNLGIRFVVESYNNGFYWYRKYNDGWVEQSGRGPSNGVGFTTVTLLVPMKDTNYTLLYNNNRGSSAADIRNAMIISSTQISVGSDGAYPIWYVCGLGAE